MIRLLIADDHAIVRGGLKQLFALAHDLQVCAEAVSGAEVLNCLREQSVDLLLLDLNMPGLSGTDLIARVKAHWPKLPILVFSMHNEAQVAARMLKAGANGYVTKDCEPDVLLAAVRKVAAHGIYIDPVIAEKMALVAMSNAAQPAHLLLSARELQVFQLLAVGHTVNTIAEQLNISNKTVSTHKAHLMENLGASNMTELIRYAMQNNLLP